ncbi:MAG TPA: carbamate kinase [Actinomycetes bacterium]|nr:carbamate kinase [Actinomycetes bacterium]
MRALIALGGNAMTGPDGDASPVQQDRAIGVAMQRVADLVGQGVDVLLTHGNGPQVGNLLVKNELAAGVVPPVPLDWCGAQTQGTIGFLILDALEAAMAARGLDRQVATVVTRTLVDGDDVGFERPTKPIGRYLPEDQARALMKHGQIWEDRGSRGWRRVVASPAPLEIVDAPAIAALAAAGYLVVGAGGGGIPVVRGADGALHGVEAVIDKDLSAALLARSAAVDVLVIATDVEHVVLGWGTADERPIERVTPDEMRTLQREHDFASGSMGPKVEAALRFVEAGGTRSVITSLENIEQAVHGRAGTVIEAERS